MIQPVLQTPVQTPVYRLTVPVAVLDLTIALILKIAGGCTVDSATRNGYWIDPNGTVFNEPVRSIEVTTQPDRLSDIRESFISVTGEQALFVEVLQTKAMIL